MTLRPWLRLCRIPNVFTAFANVLAGVLLARGGGFEVRDLSLLGASGALYTAGMVLNDFFDRRVDAIERPDRPIPAGDIRAARAGMLGLLLLISGLLCAALHGPRPLVIALLLALSILAYDGGLKATVVGPLAMGVCRFFNVLLGLVATGLPNVWLWSAPLAMGLFTVAITVLSRDEVAGGGIARTRAVVVALIALVVAIGSCLVIFATRLSPWGVLLTLALAAPFYVLLLVRGARVFAPLWRNASAPTIGRAIGGGILMMPALDATFVAAAGLPLGGVIVLALSVPAFILRRWYYLT